MAKSTQSTRKYFQKEHVVFKYGAQKSPIQIERLILDESVKNKNVPDGYHIFRPVIKIKIVKKHAPYPIVTDFQPPLTVKVRYDNNDVKNAGKGKEPRLWFWDGIKWTRCEEDYAFILIPDHYENYVGWAVIQVKHWDDPTLALGD